MVLIIRFYLPSGLTLFKNEIPILFWRIKFVSNADSDLTLWQSSITYLQKRFLYIYYKIDYIYEGKIVKYKRDLNTNKYVFNKY